MERKKIAEIRDRINQTENLSDLERSFSHAISSFLNQILDSNFNVSEEDIRFKPSNTKYYELSTRLRRAKVFKETWTHSNIPHFIEHVADSAYHKYIHIKKHQEKTTKKIRNGNSANRRFS